MFYKNFSLNITIILLYIYAINNYNNITSINNKYLFNNKKKTTTTFGFTNNYNRIFVNHHDPDESDIKGRKKKIGIKNKKISFNDIKNNNNDTKKINKNSQKIYKEDKFIEEMTDEELDILFKEIFDSEEN